MHADTASRYRPGTGSDGLTRAVVLALGIHLLIALLFFLAWWWSPVRHVEPAAGSPMVEASLVVSSADVRAATKAMHEAPKPEPKPLPEPVKQPAEEEAVPPPQPIPEPRPQDAPTPQQQQAQEHIPVPDTVNQESASALSLAKEKEKQEQEAKRKQAQIDLTEQKRQEEAQQKQRLAQQQEEERQKKLAEIRKQREQLDAQIARDAAKADLARQKLQQLAAARAAQASSSSAADQPTPGQNGTSNDLSAKYAAAIQQAVLNQWIRPDSVPLGQKCTINIRQIPGGTVIEAKVDPSCPYDEAGRRSIEAAVLRAQPLPYQGFESVFQRNLTFHFAAQDR